MNINTILAADLGNGQVCWKTASSEGSFPSLIAEVTNVMPGSEQSLFRLDKKRYLVGEQCVNENTVTKSTDSSYYESNRIRILFLYMLEQAGIKHLNLITGLPSEFFEEKKDDFAKNLKRWASDAGYQIETLKVLPQHLGPIFDRGLVDENNEPVLQSVLNGNIGVIDIGQGTIDVGKMVDGVPGLDSHGTNKGVSDIHKAVLALLKSGEGKKTRGKAGIPPELARDKTLTINRVNKCFHDKYLMFRGDKLDIWAMTEGVRRDFANKHLSAVIDEVWGVTDTLDGMIVAGGGAIVLGRSILKEHITCPILTPADPSMSIVNGFYNVLSRRAAKAA